MINYNQIKNKPNVFLSFTGLTVEEFNELLLNFASAWNNYVYKNFIQGKDRIRNYGGGNIPVLNTVEDKLLFILFYYKIYPIQEVQGFFFGMSQESACDWIGRLSVCLTEALGYERVLPKRKKENWETIFVNFPTLEIFIDGSERPVNRPEKNQKEYYSGKKKHHTVKNVFVTDKTNYVHFLTETVSGKQHDKRILDEKCGHLPRDSIVWADLGFEGIEKDNLLGSKIFMPKKKPRGGELTEYEKLDNANISRTRVKVEHAIGGVKILSIVRDKFRNRRRGFADEVIFNATGLHNFRIQKRTG